MRGLWELSATFAAFVHKPKISPKEKLIEKEKKKDVIHNLPLYSSTQNCFVGSENMCCKGVQSGLFQHVSMPKRRGAVCLRVKKWGILKTGQGCEETLTSPRTKWS